MNQQYSLKTLSSDYRRTSLQFVSDHGITLILLLMIVAMAFLSPVFLKFNNLMNVIRQVSVIAIVGIGVTIVIITKGIDLASGSVIALVSVVSASLAHPEQQLSIVVPVAVGLATGAFSGSISGILVALGKIPAFIATLGMMIAARGCALIYSEGRPISNFTDSFDFIGRGYLFGIPFPIYVMGLTAVFIHVLLTHTRFGKYVYAIGGNEQAAIVSGINVSRCLILAYTAAGALSGLAGILLTSRISVGQPTAGLGYELDAIAAAVIGGTSLSGGIGRIYGTVVGALIIGVLNNGLDLLHVNPYWQQLVKGVLIVGAVLLDKRRHG